MKKRRPIPPDGGLKEPAKPFAETFSAESLVLERLRTDEEIARLHAQSADMEQGEIEFMDEVRRRRAVVDGQGAAS